MKLFHISDLHLGKRVNEISMLDEQIYILDKILQLVASEQPDALIIAGDIYYKPVPPSEAVSAFDSFITSLAKRRINAFIISGNHDSPERIAFGSEIMSGGGIYLSPVYDGKSAPVKINDEFGAVNFYMLPFIRPASARAVFPDKEINSYTDAVSAAIEKMSPDYSQRNVIIAHQFVTGAMRCDSETVSAGGLDNVDGTVFAKFDYAALGHIHSPQNISAGNIRYSGTPLKYSLSEVTDKKSVTVVTLNEKGNVEITAVPLEPLHDMRKIRGSYMDIVSAENYTEQNRYDYVFVTLTDENDVPDAVLKLRTVYPNLMKLDYDNIRTRSREELSEAEKQLGKTPKELFGDFYQSVNGSPLSDEQQKYISQIFEKLSE